MWLWRFLWVRNIYNTTDPLIYSQRYAIIRRTYTTWIICLRMGITTCLISKSLKGTVSSQYGNLDRDGRPEIRSSFRAGARFLSLFQSFHTGSGPYLTPVLWIMGDLTPRVMLKGREADHSPSCNVDVNNIEKCRGSSSSSNYNWWSYPYTSPYNFLA